MVFDVVLFVLGGVMTIVQFATRRGSNRVYGFLCLMGTVGMLGVVLRETPLHRLLPSALQVAISVGLGVSMLLILCLGIWATAIHRRQPQ